MSFTWPVARECLPDLPDVPELADDADDDEIGAYVAAQAAYDLALQQRNNAEDCAVQVLWALSGRQYGVREVIARPCPPLGFPAAPVLPILDGCWSPHACGCVFNCAFSKPGAVHLPGPVAEVVEVQIGDSILDDDNWTVEGDLLYRTGGAVWPTQNLARPLGETGTWSVTYLRGTPPPAHTAQLAGELAKEFLSACAGEDCRLPRTLIATSQRGVSHTFDPAKIMAAGKTGLIEVDLWLAAVNPHQLPQQSSFR